MLQERYVTTRLAEEGQRDRTISPVTIKKELATFSQLWNAMKARGCVAGVNPRTGASLPKVDEAHPFQTFDEITKILDNGDFTDNQTRDYWDRLFLSTGELLELLKHAKSNARHPAIYAAMATALFTGARRSEIMRSQVSDWDFRSHRVRIRELKASRNQKTTFRLIDLHPQLEKIVIAYLKDSRTGVLTFSIADDGSAITGRQMDDRLAYAVAGSRFSIIRGWHVFRHSFCSNCARKGFTDTLIDAWMGHRGDDAIKKRYRHLFPEDTRHLMKLLFE